MYCPKLEIAITNTVILTSSFKEFNRNVKLVFDQHDCIIRKMGENWWRKGGKKDMQILKSFKTWNTQHLSTTLYTSLFAPSFINSKMQQIHSIIYVCLLHISCYHMFNRKDYVTFYETQLLQSHLQSVQQQLQQCPSQWHHLQWRNINNVSVV